MNEIFLWLEFILIPEEKFGAKFIACEWCKIAYVDVKLFCVQICLDMNSKMTIVKERYEKISFCARILTKIDDSKIVDLVRSKFKIPH